MLFHECTFHCCGITAGDCSCVCVCDLSRSTDHQIHRPSVICGFWKSGKSGHVVIRTLFSDQGTLFKFPILSTSCNLVASHAVTSAYSASYTKTCVVSSISVYYYVCSGDHRQCPIIVLHQLQYTMQSYNLRTMQNYNVLCKATQACLSEVCFGGFRLRSKIPTQIRPLLLYTTCTCSKYMGGRGSWYPLRWSCGLPEGALFSLLFTGKQETLL